MPALLRPSRLRHQIGDALQYLRLRRLATPRRAERGSGSASSPTRRNRQGILVSCRLRPRSAERASGSAVRHRLTRRNCRGILVSCRRAQRIIFQVSTPQRGPPNGLFPFQRWTGQLFFRRVPLVPVNVDTAIVINRADRTHDLWIMDVMHALAAHRLNIGRNLIEVNVAGFPGSLDLVRPRLVPGNGVKPLTFRRRFPPRRAELGSGSAARRLPRSRYRLLAIPHLQHRHSLRRHAHRALLPIDLDLDPRPPARRAQHAMHRPVLGLPTAHIHPHPRLEPTGLIPPLAPLRRRQPRLGRRGLSGPPVPRNR